ncbi:MAG: GTPase domain-containing protein [Fimbriiglobus sp.]
MPRSSPRILFFGPKGSGKSALLGQFLKRLTDRIGSESSQIPVEGPDTKLQREITPHRVQVNNPSEGILGGHFELCDCDGTAASEFLSHADRGIRERARSVLAAAIRTADALVLAVDAGASVEELNQTFSQFQQFLKVLQEEREFQREVGGWPIFLTLTKCDVLHRVTDTSSQWLRRVEDRKAEILDRFHEFFGDDITIDTGFHSFGSLTVKLAATAIECPAGPTFLPLADEEGSFGITDLVSEALWAAREQESRIASARKRLRFTVSFLGALVFGMLLAGLWFFSASGPTAIEQLAERIRFYQQSEPPPAIRYAERQLPRHVKDLTAFQQNEHFGAIPDELRGFVTGRLKEAEDYKAYRAKFQPPRLGPAEVRDREQAEVLRVALQTELALPESYKTTWPSTEAGLLAAKWQKDLGLMLAAETQIHEWYRSLIRRGNEQLLTPQIPDAVWGQQVEALITEAAKPPLDPNSDVPGSPVVAGLRGRRLTYQSAYRFERSALAKRDWLDTERRLFGAKKLTDAVGLTQPSGSLILASPPPSGADLTASEVLARHRRPGSTGPISKQAFAEWFEATYPEPITKAIESRLLSLRQLALSRMQTRLAAECDRTSRIQLQAYLQNPAIRSRDLAWDELVNLYDDLLTKTPHFVGPSAALANFVAVEKHPVDLARLTLEWPDDLLENRATPVGPLVITITSAGQAKDYLYSIVGEPERLRPISRARYAPQIHAGQFNFTPTDDVTATLTLRSNGQEYRLRWSSPRADFRFTALGDSPTLETPTGPRPTRNVTLIPSPRLPELLR